MYTHQTHVLTDGMKYVHNIVENDAFAILCNAYGFIVKFFCWNQ